MEQFKHVLNGGLRANTNEEADGDLITLDGNEGNYEDDENTKSWIMTSTQEDMIRGWERKILRRIYGGVLDTGMWLSLIHI